MIWAGKGLEDHLISSPATFYWTKLLQCLTLWNVCPLPLIPECWRQYVDFPLEHLTCVPLLAHPTCLQDMHYSPLAPSDPQQGGQSQQGGAVVQEDSLSNSWEHRKEQLSWILTCNGRIQFSSALLVLPWPVMWICGVPIPQHGGKENWKLKSAWEQNRNV